MSTTISFSPKNGQNDLRNHYISYNIKRYPLTSGLYPIWNSGKIYWDRYLNVLNSIYTILGQFPAHFRFVSGDPNGPSLVWYELYPLYVRYGSEICVLTYFRWSRTETDVTKSWHLKFYWGGWKGPNLNSDGILWSKNVI